MSQLIQLAIDKSSYILINDLSMWVSHDWLLTEGIIVNKDLKGLCLFLGMIGLAYAAILVLTMLFTGVKILKSIIFISAFSSFLISLGLTPHVKQRLVQVIKQKASLYK